MVAPQSFFSPRGTPLSVYHRIADLEALGHDVDVLTYPVGLAPSGLRARIYRSPRIPLINAVGPGPSVRKLALDSLLAASLWRRLAAGGYALVYAHEEGAFMAAVAAPRFACPYIYEMHSACRASSKRGRERQRRRAPSSAGSAGRHRAPRGGGHPPAALGGSHAPSGRTSTWRRCSINLAPPMRQVGARADPREPGIDDRMAVMPAVCTGAVADLLVRAIDSGESRAARPLRAGRRTRRRHWLATARVESGRGRLCAAGAAAAVQREAGVSGGRGRPVSPRVRGVNAPGKLMSYLQSGRPVVANDVPSNQLFDRARS
jgi:hypothetical protein